MRHPNDLHRQRPRSPDLYPPPPSEDDVEVHLPVREPRILRTESVVATLAASYAAHLLQRLIDRYSFDTSAGRSVHEGLERLNAILLLEGSIPFMRKILELKARSDLGFTWQRLLGKEQYNYGNLTTIYRLLAGDTKFATSFLEYPDFKDPSPDMTPQQRYRDLVRSSLKGKYFSNAQCRLRGVMHARWQSKDPDDWQCDVECASKVAPYSTDQAVNNSIGLNHPNLRILRKLLFDGDAEPICVCFRSTEQMRVAVAQLATLAKVSKGLKNPSRLEEVTCVVFGRSGLEQAHYSIESRGMLVPTENGDLQRDSLVSLCQLPEPIARRREKIWTEVIVPPIE